MSLVEVSTGSSQCCSSAAFRLNAVTLAGPSPAEARGASRVEVPDSVVGDAASIGYGGLKPTKHRVLDGRPELRLPLDFGS